MTEKRGHIILSPAQLMTLKEWCSNLPNIYTVWICCLSINNNHYIYHAEALKKAENGAEVFRHVADLKMKLRRCQMEQSFCKHASTAIGLQKGFARNCHIHGTANIG